MLSRPYGSGVVIVGRIDRAPFLEREPLQQRLHSFWVRALGSERGQAGQLAGIRPFEDRHQMQVQMILSGGSQVREIQPVRPQVLEEILLNLLNDRTQLLKLRHPEAVEPDNVPNWLKNEPPFPGLAVFLR